MSKQMLHSLALNPKTRLLYWTQRSRELIFPFCVYEAKSAMGGTIGFAENQGAVGVATAAALLSELAKLSGAAASTSPPVFMLASMGYAWTIHACVASIIGHTDHFHIYPVTTILGHEESASTLAVSSISLKNPRVRVVHHQALDSWASHLDCASKQHRW